MPGWAVYHKGKLVGSGTIAIPGGQPVQDRLSFLYKHLAKQSPDVLVVERIRGSRAHEFLHWAVGVTVAATCPLVVLEIPIATWKKRAGKNHVKSDENDAKAMGQAVVDIAREL